MLKTVIWMRKVIVAVGFFFVYLQRSTSESFGYGIVPRNPENHFWAGFQEAAHFENSENWREDWIGQPRSSQPEVDFQDFRDSGEPGAGPEEDFKGFWKSSEGI